MLLFQFPLKKKIITRARNLQRQIEKNYKTSWKGTAHIHRNNPVTRI